MQVARQDNIKDKIQAYIQAHGHIDCILVDEVQFLMP